MNVKAIHCLVAAIAVLALPTASRADRSGVQNKFLFTQPNASAPPQIIRAGADKVADEYLVVFNDDILSNLVPAVAHQVAAAHGAQVKKIWSNALKGMFVTMTDAMAEAVRYNPLVKYVEENATWHLSGTQQQTNIDPKLCDPTAGNCPAVVDDRLWHLDRLDQNTASPNNSFSYCTDATGVTVYVVDTGVNKNHNEFVGPTGSRVQAGFNSSGDGMPADDPCLGFAVPPVGHRLESRTNSMPMRFSPRAMARRWRPH